MTKERKAIGQKAMVGHPIAQATGIKTWPEDDRPREKLLKKGAGALSNSELLAILLRTGTHGTSAIDLARKILKKFSTFRNMAHTDTRDWKEFKGLGGAKIAHIQAALEIGRRFRQDDVFTGKQKIASANVFGAKGVAVEYFPMGWGVGEADYVLFVNGEAAGIIKAKKEGETLVGKEPQSAKYSKGFPKDFRSVDLPLPFVYETSKNVSKRQHYRIHSSALDSFM